MQEGIAGKIAKAFIRSRLTILLMIAFLLIGGYSTLLIPREEEPQIQVPMADLFVGYPGASPEEVESRVSEPLEKMISNIKGVEYVYSTSMKGQSMLIVQFYVGEDVERSMVKLYNELMKNMDKMPQGVTMPLVKTRAIDDVPALSLTLWSDKEDDYSLRQLAEVVTGEIKKVPDVADVSVIGGRSRQIRVILDKDKMAEARLDISSIARSIPGGNARSEAGQLLSQDTSFLVDAGNFLKDAGDVENLVVGVGRQQQPVYLRQIARVVDGPALPSQYVFFRYGRSDTLNNTYGSTYPAVTLAIAKRKGADAMHLSEQILRKTGHLRHQLIPSDVHLTVTRNYGATASEKVSELLLHLFIAIVAVTAFVMLAMGWRGGLVVFLSVPVTFALTLFSYYLLHYTL
ncbi:MAG: efflux RND transporter permease subunit, partial [Bacteroidetes bacterium]|nr:efflux RND transporter permease subunit [Bacteroidota bacterium]